MRVAMCYSGVIRADSGTAYVEERLVVKASDVAVGGGRCSAARRADGDKF
jgi:hypothetical protein